MSRLAFVVPRYGPDILGGAETMAREMAERLAQRGHQVTALTTCMRDYATWANVDPPGRSSWNDVTIERFLVEGDWRTPSKLDLWARLPNLTIDEQYAWVHNLPHAPGLYQHLIDHGQDYDLVFFIPYLYSTSYYGSSLVNDRAIIWPCLHNELFAFFHPTRSMLAMAHGTYYNSPAEQVLAHKLGVTNPREFVVGFGVPTLRADPQRFRSEFDLASPYLIYSGRLEEAKNYHTLADYFARYKQAHGGDLKLVVMGDGPLRQVKTHADFIYTGFRKGQDMYDAIAGALALCQPSLQESFSIVIMEAWALGVPVMVNAGCPVTAEHALQSQGGLIFSSYSQFVRALDTLVTQPEARATLGHSGKQYVSTRYNWDAVMQRMETALGVWLNGT